MYCVYIYIYIIRCAYDININRYTARCWNFSQRTAACVLPKYMYMYVYTYTYMYIYIYIYMYIINLIYDN